MKSLAKSETITHVTVGVPCEACNEKGLQTWREPSTRIGGKSQELTGKCRECKGSKIVPRMVPLDEFMLRMMVR